MTCRVLSPVYRAVLKSVSCFWCDVCHYLFLCLWWTKSLSLVLPRFCCLWIQSFAYGVSRCGFPCLSYLTPVERFLTSHFFGNIFTFLSISVHISPLPLYRDQSCCSLLSYYVPLMGHGLVYIGNLAGTRICYKKSFWACLRKFHTLANWSGEVHLPFCALVFWSEWKGESELNTSTPFSLLPDYGCV